MASESWVAFSDTVNVLTLLDLVKTPAKAIYRNGACGRLTEVKQRLDDSEALLEQMRDKDKLLGKIIEKESPGFTKEFQKQLKDLRTQHDLLWLKVREASWLQRTNPFSTLVSQAGDLYNEVTDLYGDKLKTSVTVRLQNVVYKQMDELYNQVPPVMTEEELDVALDKLHRQAQLLLNEFGGLPVCHQQQNHDDWRAPPSTAVDVPMQPMPGALTDA